MTAATSLTESILKIAEVLRERPPQHWLLNRAASDIDQLGRRLHGLGLAHDREIADCFTSAIGELAAAHELPEDRRPETVGRGVAQLDAAVAWLATGAPPS
jgi:hypothetical protein